jgi:D-3-phosphoglycerate dehydrogenase
VKTSYPREKISILLLESIHPRAEEMLKAEGFSVRSHAKALEAAELKAAAAKCHVLGIRSKTTLTREILEAAPQLLSVGCFCIGTNQVEVGEACQRGVAVFNAPFSNTRSVAELTVAEVVALARQLFQKSAGLHRGEWDKSAAGSREVRGKTLGIVGYGHIGSQVSVLAEGLGMRVVYYDIVAKLPIGNARPVRTLDELLAASDFVTLHVPETPRTRDMIGAAQIKKMKPGAFLINNARGTVVMIPALAAALKEGRLGGAAIDVFPLEPTGKGEKFASELCGLGNAILTPHIGGSTEEAQESIAEDVASKLIKFINNGSTTGSVNVPQVELPEQGGRVEAAGKDAPPESSRHHRLLHFHRNVPGVLSKMHGVIAGLGVNINAEYLQTNRDVGYVVLDVDPTHGANVLEGLRSIPETIRVRMLW